MKIVVLGGDGFCGWPTTLHLSKLGHDVVIADNLSRRRWDDELGVASLTPIRSVDERLAAWHEASSLNVTFEIVDLLEGDSIRDLIERHVPDAVVHFAEQSSAPYSMIDREHAVFTQTNNVVGTLNLVFALAEALPTCHLVKLGTMGEYGTPNIDIEEGFLKVEHNGRRDVLPFPKQPGSFYHLSKVHDSHNLAFAARAFDLRVTDLNQGVVYGNETAETRLDERLVNRFDYDGVFGTVLNRFCAQAAIGHALTLYGGGGQVRGFLDIRDTACCIELAIESPPRRGEFRVFNQFTAQFSVSELADLVQEASAELGLDVSIDRIPNPRVEAEGHYYRPRNRNLLALGLEPHPLSAAVVRSLLRIALKWRGRIDVDAIPPRVTWRRLMTTPACVGSPAKRQMTRTGTGSEFASFGKPPTNWRYWARARYGTLRDVPITWGRRARSARQRPGHVPGSDSSVLGESPWGTRGKVTNRTYGVVPVLMT